MSFQLFKFQTQPKIKEKEKEWRKTNLITPMSCWWKRYFVVVCVCLTTTTGENGNKDAEEENDDNTSDNADDDESETHALAAHCMFELFGFLTEGVCISDKLVGLVCKVLCLVLVVQSHGDVVLHKCCDFIDLGLHFCNRCWGSVKLKQKEMRISNMCHGMD